MGLNPGPLLFVEHKDFVWGLIASMYLGNIVGLVMVLTTVPVFAAILRVPFAAIAPMIVVSCAIGAYAIQNAMFDIWLMLVFGVVGYVFKKIGIPLAPFTLALVLGSRAEDAFRLSMIGAGRRPARVLVEWAGRLDHHAGLHPAVLAGDREAGFRQRGAVVAGQRRPDRMRLKSDPPRIAGLNPRSKPGSTGSAQGYRRRGTRGADRDSDNR